MWRRQLYFFILMWLNEKLLFCIIDFLICLMWLVNCCFLVVLLLEMDVFIEQQLVILLVFLFMLYNVIFVILLIKIKILKSFFLRVFIILFNVFNVIGVDDNFELLVIFCVCRGNLNIVEFLMGNFFLRQQQNIFGKFFFNFDVFVYIFFGF